MEQSLRSSLIYSDVTNQICRGLKNKLLIVGGYGKDFYFLGLEILNQGNCSRQDRLVSENSNKAYEIINCKILGVVVGSSNPGAQDIEAEEPLFQVKLQLHREFEASLSLSQHLSFYLKERKFCQVDWFSVKRKKHDGGTYDTICSIQ